MRKKTHMFVSREGLEYSKNKYVFLDTDFLSLLSQDVDVFEEVLIFLSDSFLVVDPLVEFEFLRDTFLPGQQSIKEQFVSNQEIFFPVDLNPITFLNIRENALVLSRVYAHQRQGKKRKENPSTVDLFLAARIMLNPASYCLLTGNKKDYSSSLFDTKTVLSFETEEGDIRNFSILAFNPNKFNSCYGELANLKTKMPLK